jgi:hypothetical protein
MSPASIRALGLGDHRSTGAVKSYADALAELRRRWAAARGELFNRLKRERRGIEPAKS